MHILLWAVLLAGPMSKAVGPATSPLLGSWNLETVTFCVFNADGSGSIAGEPFRWTADGKTITVTGGDGVDKVPYTLKGKDQLTLTIEGQSLTLRRAGKPAPASAPNLPNAPTAELVPPQAPQAPPPPVQPPRAPAPQPPAPDKQSPRGKDGAQSQLAQLLLSSAWCSFSYNKISGASSSSRVAYNRDGTWVKGRRGETYSSGQYGTVSSQTDGREGGRWEVRGEQLYMSAPPAYPDLMPVTGTITRNSNGYPIITTNGVEYSQCQ